MFPTSTLPPKTVRGDHCCVRNDGSHLAWAQHPRHREAQEAGKERLYSEYRIEVYTYAFPAEARDTDQRDWP
jgi:hypothetical protein